MEQKRDIVSIMDEIGYVGRIQIVYFVLILFITFYTGVQSLAYVFTAGHLHYRCHIDECDTNVTHYNPDWLKFAVPFNGDNKLPEQCYKYIFIGDNTTNRTSCRANDFDRTFKTMKCDKFVFENDEKTILTEFNLTCEENNWKLALPGTVHSIGLLINLLITGYVSDRYGRKIVLIISTVLGAIVGIFQPFAWNYATYVVLKFIEKLLGGSAYSVSTVLTIELVNPSHRAQANTIIYMSSALGKVFLGFTAMLIDDWKSLTFVCYTPHLITIAFIWIIPESFIWLLVNGRCNDTAVILLRIIKWNNIKVSPEIIEILTKHCELITLVGSNTEKESYPIWDVLKSRTMLLRIVMLSYCFITNVLILNGTSLASVNLVGNKYTNFMVVSIIEIPACILVIKVSHRVGRKKFSCSSYTLCGLSLLLYTFVPDCNRFKLILFLIGKFAITMSFSIMLIQATELMPTNMRQTLIGVCTSIGYIGAIIASQAPMLDLSMTNLSIYIFGGTALLATVISLQFPETLNIKLPNTIEEALHIG